MDTPGQAEARKTADALRVDPEKEEAKMEAAKASLEIQRRKLATIFRNDVVIGTEDIGVDDLNIPQLKIVQPNKRIDLANGKRAEDGYLYRTDTREQMPYADVTLLVVRKVYTQNYKKDGMERQHIYFGVYDDTNDPFRMFSRGWSLEGSRAFMTEVKAIQKKFYYPMYALKVRVSTQPKSGVTKDNAEYAVFSSVFSILKDEETGEPMVEFREDRVQELRKFAEKFMAMEVNGMEDEDAENNSGKYHANVDHQIQDQVQKANGEVKDAEPVLSGVEETIAPEDIPF